ncbi:hypothetical protein ACC710_38105, partial [Rhizobium ruizarguesonis]
SASPRSAARARSMPSRASAPNRSSQDFPVEATALKREDYFCSGCPHSVSTRLPEGSRASTGIGCHMMIIGNEDRS